MLVEGTGNELHQGGETGPFSLAILRSYALSWRKSPLAVVSMYHLQKIFAGIRFYLVDTVASLQFKTGEWLPYRNGRLPCGGIYMYLTTEGSKIAYFP